MLDNVYVLIEFARANRILLDMTNLLLMEIFSLKGQAPIVMIQIDL